MSHLRRVEFKIGIHRSMLRYIKSVYKKTGKGGTKKCQRLTVKSQSRNNVLQQKVELKRHC